MKAAQSRDKVSALTHQPLTIVPATYKREIEDDPRLKVLFEKQCRQVDELRQTDMQLRDGIVRSLERRLACN
jgi:hypothetical protein